MEEKTTNLWSAVWNQLASFGTLDTSDPETVKFTANAEKAAAGLPLATQIYAKPIFSHSTRSAKKKGWDWSGDTTARVYTFTAPSLEVVSRANRFSLIYIFFLASGTCSHSPGTCFGTTRQGVLDG